MTIVAVGDAGGGGRGGGQPDIRLVIKQEPDDAWCQLQGETPAEWNRLEEAAARGERTSGPGIDAIDRLRALAAGLGMAVAVERR